MTRARLPRRDDSQSAQGIQNPLDQNAWNVDGNMVREEHIDIYIQVSIVVPKSVELTPGTRHRLLA